MESDNMNRISANGLKSVEIDELNTYKIIINNEGLQYFHEYNIGKNHFFLETFPKHVFFQSFF
jgi:hypothetical protein